MILQIIGFLCLIVGGLWSFAAAYIAACMAVSFGGGGARFAMVMGFVTGCAMFWLAFHFAPFEISWAVSNR